MTATISTRLARIIERSVDRIEHADALDRPAEAVAAMLRRVIRPGPVEDALSGMPAGHPAHPALVAVPIGAWVTAHALDVTGHGRAAGSAQALGVIAALPAAATGASDWMSTAGAERRVGLVHAAINYAAVGVHAGSWCARRAGHTSLARTLGFAGTVLVGAAGWLGGHLVYAQGVGVDTTAFSQFPTEWTDALALDAVPAIGVIGVDVNGIPLLFTRRGDRIVALADRCTLRGGALSDGSAFDGCVECPWHGSVFSLDDGAVLSGPATRPQPAFITRVVNGLVLVRRDDQRALRLNPTGT